MRIAAFLVAAGCALVLLAHRAFRRADGAQNKGPPSRERSGEHADHPCGECMLASFLESR